MRRLLDILNKRSVAWCVLAVMVLLSLSLSGGGALRDYRNETMDVFRLGVNGDGLSIESDLAARVKAAKDFATAARAAGMAENVIAAVESAAEALAQAGSISQKYLANAKLDEDFNALAAAAKDAAIDETTQKQLMGYVTEFRSRQDTIGRDAYNELAEQFNASLQRFPASFIAMIGGVSPVELFA